MSIDVAGLLTIDVAGLLTEPQGVTAGLRDARETCGRTLGGVRRPAPNSGKDFAGTPCQLK